MCRCVVRQPVSDRYGSSQSAGYIGEVAGAVRSIAHESASSGDVRMYGNRGYVNSIPPEPVEVEMAEIVVADGGNDGARVTELPDLIAGAPSEMVRPAAAAPETPRRAQGP